jgi:putative ABC transport system ATP-binding protein
MQFYLAITGHIFQISSKKREEKIMSNQEDSLIRLDEVIKRYPAGDQEITVLNGINLEINPGEFVAIVGASGNGKSTLLNMITGIDHPTEGEVVIGGVTITNLNEEKLTHWRGRNIGIVFQFFQLLPALNLLQNVILPMDFIKYGSKKERKARAEHLLDLVGLGDQMAKLPSQVSGGQQQRAAIARALSNDPPLIVADEPTGNLDANTSADVFNLFSKLVDEGKTLVMVTHDEDLACQVPRRIEVANGEIVFDGRCNE